MGRPNGSTTICAWGGHGGQSGLTRPVRGCNERVTTKNNYLITRVCTMLFLIFTSPARKKVGKSERKEERKEKVKEKIKVEMKARKRE